MDRYFNVYGSYGTVEERSKPILCGTFDTVEDAAALLVELAAKAQALGFIARLRGKDIGLSNALEIKTPHHGMSVATYSISIRYM